MPMKPYVIKQGDYLSKLAYQMGFDMNAVWEASENEEIRTKRPCKDVLYPGDVLYVPHVEPKEESVSAGGSNGYAANVPSTTVELEFVDDAGKPLSDQPCEVQGLIGGSIESKRTDGSGVLKLEVPVTAREFTVTFKETIRWDEGDEEGDLVFNVRMGDMDPLSEQAGVVKRLSNLGYLPDCDGLPEEVVAELLPAGIKSFQRSHGMEMTGELTDDVRQLLDAAHEP